MASSLTPEQVGAAYAAYEKAREVMEQCRAALKGTSLWPVVSAEAVKTKPRAKSGVVKKKKKKTGEKKKATGETKKKEKKPKKTRLPRIEWTREGESAQPPC